MANIKGKDMQTQRQHNDVLSKKTEAFGEKPLRRPPSGQ